ncbi:hypothetical protein FHS27_006373 [Rhodopirellula rubra]|uniref:Uncharacterized protein n=1 Tax=Aporhodopirellula rubra TaxID=980271 RepID=A0A7W5E5E3_9BACT|nr:hypothetical protein [Aporhodopirellula rubra]MBB3210526.1 hypothetical protein [Aporhodopirellula rubra]
MQLRPHEIALGIVRGDFDDMDGAFPDPRNAFTPEEAVNFLEDFTGESHGTDAAMWTQWFADCPDDLINDFYDAYNDLMHSPDGRLFDDMRQYANSRGANVTNRRCPKCDSLCPEYRAHCYACRHELGRA